MGFQLREWLGLRTTRPALTFTLVPQPLALPGVEGQTPRPGLQGNCQTCRRSQSHILPSQHSLTLGL